MQSPDYLSQMANLVRENPSITVREIARELQFADNKSVYYWLEKHNFHGINEFKRVVLSDAGRFTEGLAVVQNGRQRYLVRVALFAWSPKEKNPVGEWCFLYNHPNPQGLIAVQVGDQSYSPWLMPRDILIVQADAGRTEMGWVLLTGGGRYHLAVRTLGGTMIDPRTGQAVSQDHKLVGVIVRQERIFQCESK
ncbi:MAG: hypothetical protein GX195_05455 [Firmicutes bacterium]|nr:hypothetical protein [Bacillota bacterium]